MNIMWNSVSYVLVWTKETIEIADCSACTDLLYINSRFEEISSFRCVFYIYITFAIIIFNRTFIVLSNFFFSFHNTFNMNLFYRFCCEIIVI
jgi:hypothetical protein